MTSGVVSCAPETCLRTVARTMVDRRVDSVTGRPVGVISTLDVARAVAAEAS